MSLLDFNMPGMDTPDGQGLLAAAFSLLGARKMPGERGLAGALGQAGQQYMQTRGSAQDAAQKRNQWDQQMKWRAEDAGAQRNFQREQMTMQQQARADQLTAQTQARAEQLQQQHQARMEALETQNASRAQQQQAQREFQAQQAEITRQHQLQMKQMFSSMGGGAQPYFQPVQTAQGVFAFNARTGKVEPVTGPGGTAIVGSQSDPTLQGRIAGAKEGAKADVEKGVEAGKAVKRSDMMLSQIDTAENILKGGRATESGIGSLVDTAGRFVGASSKSAQDAAKLESLSGWLTANVPRMEGPQSNFDVQTYQTMAGKIGDRTVPIPERMAAVAVVRKLQDRYKAINQIDAPAATPSGPKRIKLDAQGNVIP